MAGFYRMVTVGATLVGCAFGGMAAAAVMQATYRGTIDDDGADQTNLFGAGPSLVGQPFKLVFVYDPGTPGALRTTTTDSDEVGGGSDLGAPSPMLSARITINRHTEHFGTDNYGAAYSGRSGDFSLSAQITDYDVSTSTKRTANSVIAVAYSDLLDKFPTSLDQPVPFTRLAGDGSDARGNGNFSFYECVYAPGECRASTLAYGSFTATSVKVTAAPAPVPVPAALPLLAFGIFGLVLLTLRRRTSGMSLAT